MLYAFSKTSKVFNVFQHTIIRAESQFFSHIKPGPPDPIFGLMEAHKYDENPKKINLVPGKYVDDNGNPWVLPSVREAEKRVFNKNLDKEYQTIDGYPDFYNLGIRLAFGNESKSLENNLNATVQTIGGNGALYVSAAFLKKFWQGNRQVFVPTPSWTTHDVIFKNFGFKINNYRYYDSKTYSLDFNGLKEDICKIPKGSIIILHACANNPTGVDPTHQQWCELSKIIKQQNIYPVFDMAYQGFASGDVHHDAFSLRLFEYDGHQLCLAQSFAKNMGIYGERVGTLTFICQSQEEAQRVMSQMKILIRKFYVTPPIHGARIAKEILNDPELTLIWLKDVQHMAERIKNMRCQLKENLIQLGSERCWDHITNQHGMFCYSGLTENEVERLMKDYSIYVVRDGRIAVSAITTKNVEYLAQGIHEVTK